MLGFRGLGFTVRGEIDRGSGAMISLQLPKNISIIMGPSTLSSRLD